MKKVTNTEKQNPIGLISDATVLGPSRAIEKQEAEGQSSFVGSDTLPTNPTFRESREILESWGFKFLGPVEGDSLFEYVKLPDGWKRVGSNHSMWSAIHDEKGRERIAVFYKAAFYDRAAHYTVNHRFTVHKDYNEQDCGRGIAVVRDAGKVIHVTTPIDLPKGDGIRFYELADKAVSLAIEWLEKQYPDWRKVSAYWD